MLVIEYGLAELRLSAWQEKRLSRMPDIYEVEYDVSDVSVVFHPS